MTDNPRRCRFKAMIPQDVGKEVLVEGKADSPTPPYPSGTQVRFHYECRTVKADEEIDNTRKMSKPMELLFGKKFKMEVWEDLLQSMKVGERAKFSVPKSYLQCYPIVSKAVRDSNKPKTEPSHHCCGMMQQGIGYPDLDKLMDHPQDMNFIFEILEINLPGEYEQESWQLNEHEKLASIPSLQKQGNEMYGRGDNEGARSKYFEALARLEQLTLRERPGSKEAKDLDTQKVPLLLNYALCLMNKEDYYEAIEHLTTALTVEPNNVKGLFRRGKCHRRLGNDEASQDWQKAMMLDPSIEKLVKKECQELLGEKRERDLKDKARFQKIFNKS